MNGRKRLANVGFLSVPDAAPPLLPLQRVPRRKLLGVCPRHTRKAR